MNDKPEMILATVVVNETPFSRSSGNENAEAKGLLKVVIMKRLQKHIAIASDNGDKIYFLEMMIFLILMIICIAGIVYLGKVLLQSSLEKATAQSFSYFF